MLDRYPEDYLPRPRKCERCGGIVLSAQWYGGQGGEVIVDADPVPVVRFVGGELTAWVANASDGSDAAKRNAAAAVSFDSAHVVHVCVATAAYDEGRGGDRD